MAADATLDYLGRPAPVSIAEKPALPVGAFPAPTAGPSAPGGGGVMPDVAGSSGTPFTGDASTVTTTPCSITRSLATAKRRGWFVRKRSMIGSISRPSTLSCGPVKPAPRCAGRGPHTTSITKLSVNSASTVDTPMLAVVISCATS